MVLSSEDCGLKISPSQIVGTGSSMSIMIPKIQIMEARRFEGLIIYNYIFHFSVLQHIKRGDKSNLRHFYEC